MVTEEISKNSPQADVVATLQGFGSFDFVEVDTLEDDGTDDFEFGEEIEEADYWAKLAKLKEGDIVVGKVLEKNKDSVLVDIGFKSEGYVALEEFPERGKNIESGDDVEVYIESFEDEEGRIVLSKDMANKIKIWAKIANAFENQEVIKGTVIAQIKGGLTVDIGLKAFLPGSQIDLRPVRNLDRMIGDELELKVINMNRKRGNIILSRRALLEKKREESREETLKIMEDGSVMEGQVKNITDYGVFVDIGGVDGLLHITDMSWGRVNHPSEMFALGDKITVKILKFDKDKGRVSLGLKQLGEDPWLTIEEKYPVSSVVKGKVVSITDYGAFLELENGIEGLVHISEMTWGKHNLPPSKFVAIGDIVEAKILNIEADKKRISLGMKQTESNPWDTVEERYPVDSIVEGTVRNLTDFGAFIEIDEGIDGLVHVSDLSWNKKIKKPSDILKKKDVIKVKILHIDKESQRLSLGVKQLEEDPWLQVASKYPVGSDVKGEVVKLINFGAFVEVEDGVEGLVHVSEISSEKVAHPKDALEVGDTVEARVIKVDIEEHRLGLSVRAFKENLEVSEIQDVPISSSEIEAAEAEEAQEDKE
ncbi:MAG: 30S ribosomal protein S1 [Nitrospinae bacterium]|nr:30S ribosomal protein S1 [Nitrospinota bacterium]